MGGVRRTVQNLEIIEVDEERNLLFIKGSVSGHVNSDLIVTPATKSKKTDREIFVTPETSSEEAQPETPETSSEEAQPETSEKISETEEEEPISSDQENIEKV